MSDVKLILDYIQNEENLYKKFHRILKYTNKFHIYLEGHRFVLNNKTKSEHFNNCIFYIFQIQKKLPDLHQQVSNNINMTYFLANLTK